MTVEAEARSRSDLAMLGDDDLDALLRDVTAGWPLPKVLESLARAIEKRVAGTTASVMLVESGRLRLGAAPNLPEGYNRAADNHPVGEGMGSCGTSAHRGQLVVVEDIDTDPLWKNYREIARRYRLGACWSMPIMSSTNRVLGALALYDHEPRRPSAEELAIMRHFADLAALAIDHHGLRAALQEREQELRGLVEDLEGMSWEPAGDSRRFRFVSRGAAELLGPPPEVWYAQPGLWEKLIHPEDRAATLRRHRQAVREQVDCEFAYRLLGVDGRLVWIRDMVHVKTDPTTGAQRLLGAMVNISSQREAEQEREYLLRRQLHPDALERQRAEEALRLLADAGAELATLQEPEATARSVAEFATRQLADWSLVITRPDGEGVRCAAFAHRDPEGAPLLEELARLVPQPGGVPFGVSTLLSGGEPLLLPEIPTAAFEPGAARPELMRVIRRLGAYSAMAVPLTARDRRPDPAAAAADDADPSPGLLGVLVFVSASPGRRYGPSDLLVAEELGRRAALALVNAHLYREAQAAVRHREEFLSIAAHELRTPLATLQLSTQSILTVLDMPALDLDFVRNRVLASERQALRLGRLINNLLDVSAMKAGQVQIQPARMDLVEAVRAVLTRMQHELQRRGIDVAVHASAPVVGRWDPDRIEQVVTNLLTNAIKYGERRPVRINVQTGAGVAILQVEDQGIGMTAEVQARLFQAFERGISATHYGGLGLGLYITSQIVRAHGGTVAARSTPGEGSTFTVELPRDEPV